MKSDELGAAGTASPHWERPERVVRASGEGWPPHQTNVDEALVEFFQMVGELKRLPRQGWLDRGIATPESVADHTYRMALMAWVLGTQAQLDTGRLLRLVLVHDLPEALTGDTTPYRALIERGLSAEDAAEQWHDLLTEQDLASGRVEKTAAERVAIAELVSHLSPALAAELTDLWSDYAERRTPEAKFASQIDKLEALLQAIEYERAGRPADVASFRRSADSYVTHPVLREFLASL